MFICVGYPDYVDQGVDTVIDIHLREPQGDILLFLTGQAEIDQACARLVVFIIIIIIHAITHSLVPSPVHSISCLPTNLLPSLTS